MPSPLRLIDSHSHFDVATFDADREAALARAQAAGVVAQIVPAIDAAGWARLGEVCDAHPGLHPAYGLHPICLDAHRPEHLRQLRELLESGTRCVAIGEIGLDWFIDTLDRERQRFYFDAQLALAREFDLPVVVHARRAVEDVIAHLRRHAPLRGVVHSFAGSREQAEQLRALGFMLGIGGPVTYPRARRLRATVATMPLPQLLLETDTPDQPDSEWRGRRNEPSRLPKVLEVIAELRGEDPAHVARVTTHNAQRLFGLAGID